MALTQFPKDLYIRAMDTSEEVYLGGYTVSDAMELEYARVWLFKHGTQGGTEQFRIKAYSNALRETPRYTSDWASLSDITDITTDDWTGWFRMTFNRQNVEAGAVLYLTIEAQNYTRNANVFYVGTGLDWPETTNTQTDTPKAGGKVELYGYR